MLQHFKYERMFPNSELPGWIVSFLYEGKNILPIMNKMDPSSGSLKSRITLNNVKK